MGPPNGALVREMGPRLFQGNRSFGEILFHLCQGLNSHYFHIIGDKLINAIVGVYIPIIRIPIKRWENNHPQYNEFRPWLIWPDLWFLLSDLRMENYL